MTSDAITLTLLRADEEDAWFALYAAVRAAELAMDDWPPALRDRVLRQQFDAQRRGHRAQYPAAGEHLILLADRPIGWIVLDRSGPAWHCVDIAIAIEYRRKRIASDLLRRLQDQASAAGASVSLMLLRSNAAARALYDRLGFRVAGETETHWHMEWRA